MTVGCWSFGGGEGRLGFEEGEELIVGADDEEDAAQGFGVGGGVFLDVGALAGGGGGEGGLPLFFGPELGGGLAELVAPVGDEVDGDEGGAGAGRAKEAADGFVHREAVGLVGIHGRGGVKMWREEVEGQGGGKYSQDGRTRALGYPPGDNISCKWWVATERYPLRGRQQAVGETGKPSG